MNDLKPWWLSKTVWLNVLTLAVSIIGVFIASELFDDRLIAILAGLVVPILNIFIRWLTDEPISSVVTVSAIEKLRGR